MQNCAHTQDENLLESKKLNLTSKHSSNSNWKILNLSTLTRDYQIVKAIQEKSFCTKPIPWNRRKSKKIPKVPARVHTANDNPQSHLVKACERYLKTLNACNEDAPKKMSVHAQCILGVWWGGCVHYGELKRNSANFLFRIHGRRSAGPVRGTSTWLMTTPAL